MRQMLATHAHHELPNTCATTAAATLDAARATTRAQAAASMVCGHAAATGTAGTTAASSLDRVDLHSPARSEKAHCCEGLAIQCH